MTYNKFQRPNNIVKDNFKFHDFVKKYNNRFSFIKNIEEFDIYFDSIFSIYNDYELRFKNESIYNKYEKYFAIFKKYVAPGEYCMARFFDNGQHVIFQYEQKTDFIIQGSSVIYITIIDLTIPFDENLLMPYQKFWRETDKFINDIEYNYKYNNKLTESRFDKHDYGMPGSGNNPYRYVPYEFIRTMIKSSKQKIFDNIRKYNSVNANGNEYIKMSAAQFELVTDSDEYRYSFGNNFKKYI